MNPIQPNEKLLHTSQKGATSDFILSLSIRYLTLRTALACQVNLKYMTIICQMIVNYKTNM